MATDSETIFRLSAANHFQRRKTARIRTLVVDDTADFLNAIVAVLEEHASINIVGTASNGLEALRAAEELRPDLVLLDVTMPVMNGLEAALHLSKEMPWVKILMMSADDDPEIELACMECGADAFVWKGRFAEAFEAHLNACGLEREEHIAGRDEAQPERKAESYEFHNQHYEYYRELLEHAQSSGSMGMATSAAQMLLFHLQQLFRCLPRSRQQSMKSMLASGEV